MLLAPIFVAQAIGLTGRGDLGLLGAGAAGAASHAALSAAAQPGCAGHIAQARSEPIPRLPVGLMVLGLSALRGGRDQLRRLDLHLCSGAGPGHCHHSRLPDLAVLGGLNLGRLITIPLASRIRPRYLLLADVVGGVASLLLLLLLPGVPWVIWVATFGFGLSMANVYPTLVLLGGVICT